MIINYDKKEEYDDRRDDDDTDQVDPGDDFDNRTWEVVTSVEGGLRTGALFTYRDIIYTTETSPDLEGTVFKNKKTGKLHALKNVEINARKIINLANEELAKTDIRHLVYGLDHTRSSVFMLAERITRLPACNKGLFSKYKFYPVLCKYVGEDICAHP